MDWLDSSFLLYSKSLMLMYFIYSGEWKSVCRVWLFATPWTAQHTRLPCPSPTPGVHPNSRPSSQWCYPAIASSVIPFSSCPQSLPASGSSPKSHLFAWGGQSIRVSALASVLPMNSQDWSPFVIYFIHIYFIPLSPLGIQTFVLYICVSTTVLQISSSIPFSRFHM